MENSFCIILTIFCFSYETSWVRADTSYYNAAVVEFRPTVMKDMNTSEQLAENLKAYLAILNSPEANDTDIIVFPESTLNNDLQLTHVPSEQDKIIPCLGNQSGPYADFLRELSCAARRLRIYLVINLTEKANCTSHLEDPRPCASNNLNIFNTNVVFDREGRVISRYRKVHVYLENRNTTYKPEFAIFETDFGVRFGHFICFDMLFYTPAQEMVDRFGVTDFIFTTYFFSELPFLTAVQLQHGWAWGNNVNLLAAGGSYPQLGTTGSGIYAGQLGDLVSVMVTETGERKLYKARVPKKGTKVAKSTDFPRKPNDITKLRLLRDPQIENYNSELLDLTQMNNLQTKLCHGDLCCSFDINANTFNDSSAPDFRYRVGVFDGRRTYEKEEWSDIKVCALYTCANNTTSSCGIPLTTGNVLFRSITIKGQFVKANKLMIMPSMLDDQLYPLKHDVVEWTKKAQGDYYEVSLTLGKEQTNILTFGIYGHYYEKSSAVSATTLNAVMFTFTLIALHKII